MMIIIVMMMVSLVISLDEDFQEQSRWLLELFDRMEIIFRRTSSLQLHQLYTDSLSISPPYSRCWKAKLKCWICS